LKLFTKQAEVQKNQTSITTAPEEYSPKQVQKVDLQQRFGEKPLKLHLQDTGTVVPGMPPRLEMGTGAEVQVCCSCRTTQ